MAGSAEEERSIRLVRDEMRFEVDALYGRINSLISAEAFLTIAFTMALGNANTGLVAPILSLIGLVLALLSWPGVNTSIRIINEWNTLLIAALEAAPETTRSMWRPSLLDDGARRSDLAHRRGMVFVRAMPIVFAVAWAAFAVIALRMLPVHLSPNGGARILMNDGIALKDWLTIIPSFIGITVIPFTLLGIWRGRVRSQEAENWKARQEEIGTYNDVNAKYSEFLATLLANPDVDVGEFEAPSDLETPNQQYRRKIIFAMLVVLMERAFLLYTSINRYEEETKSKKVEGTWIVRKLDAAERLLFGSHPKTYEAHIFKAQWPGWLKYFEYYCSHAAFRDYWTNTVQGGATPETTQWQDRNFELFVNELISKSSSTDEVQRN